MQALKTLFLYTHGERETVEEYGRNFGSLWDRVEAFGGLPGIHAGLTDAILASKVTSGQAATPTQVKEGGEESSEAVKAALLISGADHWRYSTLKDALANNCLLGSDQYPDTLEKAQRILSNYQTEDHHTIQAEPQLHRGSVPPKRGTRRTRRRSRRKRRSRRRQGRWKVGEHRQRR